jgi:hypothetical protein
MLIIVTLKKKRKMLTRKTIHPSVQRPSKRNGAGTVYLSDLVSIQPCGLDIQDFGCKKMRVDGKHTKH